MKKNMNCCCCDAQGYTDMMKIIELEEKIEKLERIIEMKDAVISNLYSEVTDLDEKAHELSKMVDRLQAHTDVYKSIIENCRKYNIPV